MKILVLNGPNLNMLGIREPEIYGEKTYSDLVFVIEQYALEKNVLVDIFQSNHEGVLVDKIQEALEGAYDGIIINPAAYTHTSIAILDALKAVKIPTVEVHISEIENRESFRSISYVSMVAEKTISGKGLEGYLQAIDFFIKKRETF